MEEELRPSRSGSRATLASLSSFPFHPMASPASCSGGPENTISNNPQILDTLDPSFLNQLNNLQANQIDDLENALLPHLHSSAPAENNGASSVEQQNMAVIPPRENQNSICENNPGSTGAGSATTSTLQFKKTTTVSATVEDSFNSTVDESAVIRATNLEIVKQEFLPLLATGLCFPLICKIFSIQYPVLFIN